MPKLRYTTPHGIQVTRLSTKIPFARGLDKLLKQLDSRRGIYLSSGYEYPGRYSRWDIASVDPSIEIVGWGRKLQLHALNRRGVVILDLLSDLLRDHPHWASFEAHDSYLSGELKPLAERFPEEERSKQPSPFQMLTTLVQEF